MENFEHKHRTMNLCNRIVHTHLKPGGVRRILKELNILGYGINWFLYNNKNINRSDYTKLKKMFRHELYKSLRFNPQGVGIFK